jgi:hypothetical protein
MRYDEPRLVWTSQKCTSESNPTPRPKPKSSSANVVERGVASIGVRSPGNRRLVSLNTNKNLPPSLLFLLRLHRCVFITAGPSTKLFTWGEGDSGGHVLRETTSRGLCGLVCPSRTSERGGEGDCVKGGGGEEGEREREHALGLPLCMIQRPPGL